MLARMMKKKIGNQDHMKALISPKQFAVTVIVSGLLGIASTFIPGAAWSHFLPLLPFVVLLFL